MLRTHKITAILAVAHCERPLRQDKAISIILLDNTLCVFGSCNWLFIKYGEITTNDDNLESNLLTSFIENVWFTCWYKLNCLLLCSRRSTEELCVGNSPLQVNYAAGRLVAVIVYCFG